jgi:rhodanese-related sulfurtransferase
MIHSMKKSLLLLLFPFYLFAGVVALDIPDFENFRAHNVPIIDIRTPGEWKETGIIEKSVPLTFFRNDGSYDLEGFLAHLKRLGIDKKKPFVLVCRSASRTKTLGNFLSNKLGFEKVYELKGGILNWKAHRKPLKPVRP